MAYVKQTWVDNSIAHPVSAARMNYLENGVESVGAQVDIVAAAQPNAHAPSHQAGSPDALSTATTRSVLDVGQANQTRAGRVLTLADFTDLGLSAPAGLWNLGDLTDASGNARALTNKGAVPFGPGITGAATEAAIFAGSTAQALYRADTGAADPFRIKTGSWGCWFRTAKRGTNQGLVSKWGTTGVQSYYLRVENSTNGLVAFVSVTGTDVFQANGVSDVCDDRWHFAVATFDGTTLRLYVDGILEGSASAVMGSIFPGAAPLNFGGRQADGATAAVEPSFGREDEGFVTPDVLSEDQVRLLYAVKVAHGMALTPKAARLSVRRRRRGVTLVAGDFPSQPVRGHNLADLTDFGSGGVALTANPSTGAIVQVAGPDGSQGTARAYTGTHAGDSATDTGLPAALTARSYGIWFKTASSAAVQGLIGWGTIGTADVRLHVNMGGSAGLLCVANGADIIVGPRVDDGLLHHAVVVEDNAVADGVKRKLYLDGKLVATSTVMNSITLAGANRFRIGASPDGTSPVNGQLARAFVHAAALTPNDVQVIYAKGSQDLGLSPKNAGDHVERIDATNVYFIGDALDPQEQVELGVTV